MGKRKQRPAVLLGLATIAGLVVGLYLQALSQEAVACRTRLDFNLLSTERLLLVQENLLSAVEHFNAIVHLFRSSDTVSEGELSSFISDWGGDMRDFAVWKADSRSQALPVLGTASPSFFLSISEHLPELTSLTYGLKISSIVSLSGGTSVILRKQLEQRQGDRLVLIAAIDIGTWIEKAIGPTEQYGLPTAIYDSGQQLLYFHQPRLDAARGRPLLQPEAFPALSREISLPFADRALKIKVDASPAFMELRQSALPLLIPPSVAALFLLIAIMLLSFKKHFSRDLAAREQTIIELERFFQLNPELLCIVDASGRFLRINPAWQKMLGWSEAQMIGHSCTEFLHPDDRERTLDDVEQLSLGNEHLGLVNRYLKTDGSYLMVEWRGIGAEGLVYGAAHDVSRREHYEERLRDTLLEKETLLKEVHHRVKNNLQIISSMLNLQESESGGDAISDAIAAAQGRIRTMAMVHEALYQSETLSGVDFQDYMKSLGSVFSMSETGRPIEVRVSCEMINLSLDLALHCGLLMNELATNAMKYAFKEHHPSILILSFLCEDDCRIRLSVEDNGPGFPDGFDADRDSHLGIKLILSLASQLTGSRSGSSVEFGRSNELGGARFTLVFTPPKGTCWTSRARP